MNHYNGHSSFEHAEQEAAFSRMYGGIHYRVAIENGVRQGRCVEVSCISCIGDLNDEVIIGRIPLNKPGQDIGGVVQRCSVIASFCKGCCRAQAVERRGPRRGTTNDSHHGVFAAGAGLVAPGKRGNSRGVGSPVHRSKRACREHSRARNT